jgi:glutamine---fructose-6-phosphate transaminase (isomerizing)
MCGIFAILSKTDYKLITECIEALEYLEYRGYDSVGLAYRSSKNNINVVKTKGKVRELKQKLTNVEIKSNMIMGHTRWATHGEPNNNNAHPHISMNNIFCLVHNGIIENCDYLKKILLEAGYKFKGETDSEILVNYIEFCFMSFKKELDEKNETLTSNILNNIIKYSVKKVIGTYGIVLYKIDTPNKLFVLRNGSPISLGIAEEKIYVSSCQYSFIKHTNNVIDLYDGQLALIDNNKYLVTDIFSDEIIVPKINKIEINSVNVSKSGYEHYMLKEIMEQTQSLNSCMKGRVNVDDNKIKLGMFENKFNEIYIKDHFNNCPSIIICACGTSLNSGIIGKQIIEELCDIPVFVEQASEFRYRDCSINPKSIMIVLSQSGETADTLGALRKAKKHNILTISICNVVGSSISREADAGVFLYVGPEIGVASTKAFTGQILVLYMLALRISLAKKINSDKSRKILSELVKIPELINTILNNTENIKDIANKYSHHNNLLCLGRGYNYAVALEGALKIKEVSYIHAEGYSSSEIKHGPIALIDENMPTIIVIPKDNIYSKVISNINEIKSRKGKVILISNDLSLKNLADDFIEIPSTEDQLYPFLTVVPIQILSYYLAVNRNINVDQPRNLAKCVTVE